MSDLMFVSFRIHPNLWQAVHDHGSFEFHFNTNGGERWAIITTDLYLRSLKMVPGPVLFLAAACKGRTHVSRAQDAHFSYTGGVFISNDHIQSAFDHLAKALCLEVPTDSASASSSPTSLSTPSSSGPVGLVTREEEDDIVFICAALGSLNSSKVKILCALASLPEEEGYDHDHRLITALKSLDCTTIHRIYRVAKTMLDTR